MNSSEKKINWLRLVAGKPMAMGGLRLITSAITDSAMEIPFDYSVASDVDVLYFQNDGSISQSKYFSIKKGEKVINTPAMYITTDVAGLTCVPKEDDEFIYKVELTFL